VDGDNCDSCVNVTGCLEWTECRRKCEPLSSRRVSEPVQWRQ